MGEEIYRRHLQNCEHQNEGRRYRRCHCPIWIDGFAGEGGVACISMLVPWTICAPSAHLGPTRRWLRRRSSNGLRAFYRFAQESASVADNLAAKLKRPVVPVKPTLPFQLKEMQAILAACQFYPNKLNALRLRALILLLRYSGLRIGDASALPVSRILDGTLFLYTAKTGVPVRLPLPPVVLDALEMCPRVSEAHYFWSGESKKETLPWIWGRTLARLFKLAKIDNGHAHRFRDPFAVELLQRGIPIERVSMMLGHSSIKTTEKHYSPWISARQDQLEADVRRSWGEDAGVVAVTKGTPRVHGQRRVM